MEYKVWLDDFVGPDSCQAIVIGGVQCPHDLRPLELLNGAEIKQGNWNEQDSVINHIPSMVSLVPLLCICDASVLEKGG